MFYLLHDHHFVRNVPLHTIVSMSFHFKPISWDMTLFCLQMFLICLVLLLIPCIVFVRNSVISVDQRRPPQGRQWKLPPGPPKCPIVGNLLQVLESRTDSSRYFAYVRFAFLLTIRTKPDPLIAFFPISIWGHDNPTNGIGNLGSSQYQSGSYRNYS